MKTKKILIGMMAIFVSMSTMATDPVISNVTVKQRWPWSRLVDIDYVLTCDSDQTMDISVEAYDGLFRLTLPSDSFSGDLDRVKSGARRIVWDPTKTSYTIKGVLPEFRVTLTPTPAPLYMIVDLTKSAGEAGQIECVYESELTSGLWGAWVRNPVTNDGTVVESVVWTGVTTNDIYKTDKLVLRRIPKGTFKIGGEEGLSTTLSQDFYAGVYQVTQEQWKKVMGANPAKFKDPTNPVENVAYNTVRGATNNVPPINWPETGAYVLSSSFIGKIRDKTGVTQLDLPTEAQWEYACRAGTTTDFNNGKTSGTDTEHMNEVGWWSGNSKTNGVETTHSVGQKAPNAWGLYDMHGNVREWCRDWQEETLSGGVDPAGPESGTKRVMRGGAYSQGASSCSSNYRWRDPPTYWVYNLGFRLVMAKP
ncbi:MAG: formylglycine-generating enzyme family protein [Kiritimatiellia bacterium]